MSGISKSIVLLIAVTLCIAFVASHSIEPVAEAQAKQTEMTEDTHQDVCILVEAFVVEVNLSELYKQGVSPIGKKPDSVSVENILNCLQAREIGQVTTGVKVAIHSGQHGEAKITETIYVERKAAIPSGRRVPENVRYTNYNIGKTFGAVASVRPGGKILVSFDFTESTYRNITSTDETPPNTVSREWSGAVNLSVGRPAIAGATQNEETAVFLILCADIKDR